MTAPDLARQRALFQLLLTETHSAMISSLDARGEPFISYAPFVLADQKFYVYLSRIAEHYDYLLTHPQVQVLVIADESASPNLFARHRARFSCAATRLPDDGDHDAIFELLSDRFGASLIALLRTLDMSLFELSPTVGRFVSGFGNAFDVDLGGTRFEPVAPRAPS